MLDFEQLRVRGDMVGIVQPGEMSVHEREQHYQTGRMTHMHAASLLALALY
jgi:hypothetical protein